ncbi:hypothetical protein Ga0609869_000446 [Rhodovulum iodosum]|uniref:DUF4389 domain-containing protein n=1 Tax=Rhodovulum iodosum TaxID=68291 RepID=A0ABV3XRT1_9RHOB|nr:DUF4389 domain-containing protein [Rhodovulum robiginosum]
MADEDAKTPTEDQTRPAVSGPAKAVWIRGGWMLVLLILFSIAQTLLVATAILQFGWMLFTKKHNPHITEFGTKLGNWMATTARYQAVASEEKPFPWSEWA